MTEKTGQNQAIADEKRANWADLAGISPQEAQIAANLPPALPGRMLTAVEADLVRMGDLDKGVRGSLAALARELARAMDATGDDQPTPAQVGQLAQQLRTTLNALANVGGDQGAAEAFFRLMATAVRSGDDDDDNPRPRRQASAVPVFGEEDTPR